MTLFLFLLIATSLGIGVYVGFHLGEEAGRANGYLEALDDMKEVEGWGDWELKGYPGSRRDEDGNPKE